MRRYIAVMLLIALLPLSAAVDMGGTFTMRLQKTGTTEYGFCTYDSAGTSHESLSAIDFIPPDDREFESVSTSFGIYWNIYSAENPVNSRLVLAFSASDDNLSPYMLLAEDSSGESFLSYDANAEIYSGSTVENKEITVLPSERDSAMSTSRELELLNVSLPAYEGTDGYARITLTLNAPVDSQTMESEPFHEGIFTGYALLYYIEE